MRAFVSVVVMCVVNEQTPRNIPCTYYLVKIQFFCLVSVAKMVQNHYPLSSQRMNFAFVLCLSVWQIRSDKYLLLLWISH